MTCSDLFSCSSGSRSYRSLRAPHPFAEWLHGNCTSVLLFTLKTFISNPRMPPALEHSAVCSIPLPAWVFLKYLTLNTRLLCGSALATCRVELGPGARGPGQGLCRHSDLLYHSLGFLPSPSPPSLLSNYPDAPPLCSLTWLLLLPPGSLVSPEAPAALWVPGARPVRGCVSISLQMGRGGPGGPLSPGGLRAGGEDRRNGPVGEPRSGQRSWVVGGTSGWPGLRARGLHAVGFPVAEAGQPPGPGHRRLTGACGDPCHAHLHCVSNTSAQSAKGCPCVPAFLLPPWKSLSFFLNSVYLAAWGLSCDTWEFLCGMRGLHCSAQIL